MDRNAHSEQISNPLRSLIRWSLFVFVLLILLRMGAAAWLLVDHNPDHQSVIREFQAQTIAIGAGAWQFARPLLQLAVVLLIVDWILQRLGMQLGMAVPPSQWNTQTIIAIAVVGAFSIAALIDIDKGLAVLKDLALVVVGFYFGTQRHITELESSAGKVRQVEEHENPIPSGPPRISSTPADDSSKSGEKKP
jgi:hypothetical protein